MANIETSICEAISTIVDQAVAAAGYDKTVQAKIVGTIDATIGSYRVSYQDSTFTAYSTNTDTTYVTGTTVYVLIPSGDFSNDKTILGTVEKLGINYVSAVDESDAYILNGENVLLSSGDETFSLKSYGGSQIVTLYDGTNSTTAGASPIHPYTKSIEYYIKTSDVLMIGLTVQNSIDTINQGSGNYGIVFDISFSDNATGEEIIREFTLDVNSMSGNPYKYFSAHTNSKYFELDGANFKEVKAIYLFCEDFTYEDDSKEADIFISDIVMYGATALTEEELNGYCLTFTAPNGTYFLKNDLDTDTKEIIAQVRVKGSVVNNSSQSIEYYWFEEHAGIDSKSVYYNSKGGKGWKCLNDYNIINGTEDEVQTVEWVPGDSTYYVAKGDFLAKSITFKCVAVYKIDLDNTTTISNTIEIINDGSNYAITITSDGETQFYNDNDTGVAPTLTCLVNGEENDNFTYSWAQTTYDGTFSNLSETSDKNNDYEDLINNYNTLLEAIANEDAYKNASASLLEDYEDQIEYYSSVQRVQENHIYNLKVSSITSWTKYSCTVSADDNYYGTASITIVNSLGTEGSYSLVINNATRLYKYTTGGVSPASSAVDDPIDIDALTFTVYNNLGEALDDSVVENQCSIQWIVPTINTLLTIPSGNEATETTDDTAIYSNALSFSYGISSSFKYNCTNNDITLLVDYKGMSLSATTDFTFVKEGESGTNGTEYSCKIVPNTSSSSNTPVYPTYTYYSNTSTGSLNFDPVEEGKWFKVELYNNNTRIFSGFSSGESTEGSDVKITWSVLQNKEDVSCFSINDNGLFEFDGNQYSPDSSNKKGTPANIIKATIEYLNTVYYVTIPIIIVRLNSGIKSDGYDIELKENTGYQYVLYESDGKKPQYNTSPFELTVAKKINSVLEDITAFTGEYQVSYTWKVLENYLSISSDDSEPYIATVEPSDSFDGLCVTNAIQCRVKEVNNGLNVVGYIHIPIHLYLNKYGLSYLNSWDGNSVVIGDEDGYILAPQIGAGKKNTDNTFTGIVMGEVKTSDSATSSEVGLFGYASGQRSIFLDANSGKAEFGTSSQGKIIIDPENNTAQIYSGNYSTKNGTGMLIDLTTPEIKFGSGNFSVDSSGNLTAKGGGSIAGFNIDDDSLYTGSSKTSSSNVRFSSADFTRTVNGTADTAMRMAFSNNFGVNSSGKMYAASGIIGSGSNKITLGKSSGSSTYSAIYSGSKSSFSSTATGFYLGTDGVSLGSKFSVNNSGELVAKSGTIGSGSSTITIGKGSGNSSTCSAIYSGKSSLANTSSGFYIGTDGIALGYNSSTGTPFKVTSSGELTAKSGTIGGWTIGTSTLSIDKSGAKIFTNTHDSVGSIDDGFYLGWNGLSIGSTFKVTNSGVLTAESGTIGGWTIGTSTLEADKITLNSSGSISGGSDSNYWSIDSDGSATFSNIYIKSNDTTQRTQMNWGNFSVDTYGNLKATNAEFSGNITGSSISSDSNITGSSIWISGESQEEDEEGEPYDTDASFSIGSDYKSKNPYDTEYPYIGTLYIGNGGIHIRNKDDSKSFKGVGSFYSATTENSGVFYAGTYKYETEIPVLTEVLDSGSSLSTFRKIYLKFINGVLVGERIADDSGQSYIDFG